jgi:hypothetical protein
MYTAPNFNAVCNVWKKPATPAGGPPTFGGVLYQIYVYSRTPSLLLHPGTGRWLPLIIIREQFAAGNHLAVDDIVGHPTNLLPLVQYYRVQYSQEMHHGFPNQYYAHYSLQCNANGTIPYLPLPT